MAFADKGEASFIERVEGEADLGSQPDVTFTPDAERKVLRKIDLRLIPILLLSFALQYVDKIILNGAAQFGVIKDLHLYELKTNPVTGQPTQDLHRYSNATLIFYWGYLAGALVQRVPLGKLIPGSIICWGTVVMLTVLVKGYQAFLVQRFFLGVSESLVAPAFTIFTAMWWKKSEQLLRLCLWYTPTGLGDLLGSILLFGIDNPKKATFLDPKEKLITVKRIELSGVKPEDRSSKLYEIKEALVDSKIWL
ncbi:hypothetical protein D6C90_09247 [Aureobasidium pullulans]|uniref:MFS general substrate transporter n=1 Tax=Aureobasidium pullulans TaxID=5580 RepID=A0A4V4KKX1_AURPU|nr:hypothetical protein D6C90_09247 [Aureobasidium pullulans]